VGENSSDTGGELRRWGGGREAVLDNGPAKVARRVGEESNCGDGGSRKLRVGPMRKLRNEKSKWPHKLAHQRGGGKEGRENSKKAGGGRKVSNKAKGKARVLLNTPEKRGVTKKKKLNRKMAKSWLKTQEWGALVARKDKGNGGTGERHS